MSGWRSQSVGSWLNRCSIWSLGILVRVTAYIVEDKGGAGSSASHYSNRVEGILRTSELLWSVSAEHQCLHPLHNLLQQKPIGKWEWSSQCEEAFTSCKHLLVDNCLMVHYDSKKAVKLACAASCYGMLCAVLPHIEENGEERHMRRGPWLVQLFIIFTRRQ